MFKRRLPRPRPAAKLRAMLAPRSFALGVFSLCIAELACMDPAKDPVDGQSHVADIAPDSQNLSQHFPCSSFTDKPYCYSATLSLPWKLQTCAAAVDYFCKSPHSHKYLDKGSCDGLHYFRDGASETEVIFLCDASDAIVGYQESTFEPQVDCYCRNQGELPFCVTSTTLPACE